MAKTVLDGFADKLAGDLTDDIMSLFGFDSPIKTAHVQGGVSVASSITAAFATAIAQLQTSMATMAAATGTAASIKDVADASSVTQAINNAGDGQGINVTAPASVSMDTAETTVGGRVLNEVLGTAQTLNETILTKLVPSLEDIGDPDVGLGAKVKAGFADFLLLFPRLFDSGIQLLLNGLRMIGVGSGGSSEFDYLETGMKLAMAAFGMANGGIAKGGFKAYADGGIASRPTLGLIGEGRYNEAVVPLPDGKSIPISGNVGQNIGEINITIDSNGASTTTGSGGAGGDGKSAVNLGKAIAKAVQDELHKQKRSGGILSPYGVA